jgi:hypothetical protein
MFIAVIMLLSCASRPPAPVVPTWLPEEMMVEALKRMRALEGVVSLKSEVRASITQNGKRLGTFKGALAYRPPDSMRLRLFSPFGATIADMVRIVGRTEVHVPGKDTVYVGWTPSLVPPPGAEYKAETAGRLALVVLKDGAPAIRHVYDPVTGHNTSIEALAEGKRVMEVRMDRHKDGVPGLMVFSFESGLEVELAMKDPSIGASLGDRLFHPFGKEGLEVMPLEALGLSP